MGIGIGLGIRISGIPSNPSLPDNALTLDGDPLTLDGDFITLEDIPEP